MSRETDALESIAASLKALADVAPKIEAVYALMLEHGPGMLELVKMAQAAAARDLMSASPSDGQSPPYPLVADLVAQLEDLAQSGGRPMLSSLELAKAWLARNKP